MREFFGGREAARTLTAAELPAFAARFRGEPVALPQWPVPAPRSPEYEWQEGRGRFLWDTAANAPAPHIRRWTGQNPVIALYSGRPRSARDWSESGGSFGRLGASPDTAVEALVDWASSRRGIVDNVASVELRRPLGSSDARGFYVCFNLAASVDADANFPTDVYRTSFHGSSMYVLHRVLSRGLETSWAVNSDAGRELRGVWSLAPERFHLLSSYILYSALDNSGYVYGPLLELKSPYSDPEGRKVMLKRRSGRSNRDQRLSYVETTVMTRVFVHVIHTSEVVQDSGEAEFRNPKTMRSGTAFARTSKHLRGGDHACFCFFLDTCTV